jgi:hypothetical protein
MQDALNGREMRNRTALRNPRSVVAALRRLEEAEVHAAPHSKAV